MPASPNPAAVFLVLLLTATWATAQAPAAASATAPPTIIDDETIEASILAACVKLRERRELVASRVLAKGPVEGERFELPTVPLGRRALPVHELRDQVLRSLRIVGHHYRCRECDEWHFSGASGFCVDTKGTIATCHHVVAADETMLDASLVVADLAGNTWPVLAVLAASATSDLVLLRTAARQTVPLPLRDAVANGERVYCASNPDHQFGYFSEGLVARWFLMREPAKGAAEPAPATPRATTEWLHVTCPFAKGSSGGPIVDAMGNVVGIAQSTSTVIYDEDAQPIDTQMVMRIASPVRALLALLPPAEPAREGVPAKLPPR